jgi:hypothetical protein
MLSCARHFSPSHLKATSPLVDSVASAEYQDPLITTGK